MSCIDRSSLFATVALAAFSFLIAGTAAPAADKPFQPGAAASYAHQQSENVTVGAKPFSDDESVGSAFGKKIDFAKYGVVPMLLVIENKRDKALDLRAMQVSLVAADGRHANAVSSEELPSLATSGRHPAQTGIPSPVPLPKKKNPLAAPVIGVRALAAQIVAPGDSASGFVYFEAKAEPGDKIYLSGMHDARSGQELLYFEFPLEK